MAALAGITAVRITSNTVTKKVKCGATVSPGQPVYLDSADSEYKLADSNDSVATAEARGIAINSGVDGGYLMIATGGDIILVGATMGVGETYFVGPTAGTLIPDADLTTGDYVTEIGTAATSTQLNLDIDPKGIQHA